MTNVAAPLRSNKRPWLLPGGKPHRPGSRLQLAVRRAFLANLGQQQLTTTDLVGYCYPRVRKLKGGHYRHIWRAAVKVCVCLGRQPNTRGRPNLWVLKPPPAAK
jgi:hypothetical protein